MLPPRPFHHFSQDFLFKHLRKSSTFWTRPLFSITFVCCHQPDQHPVISFLFNNRTLSSSDLFHLIFIVLDKDQFKTLFLELRIFPVNFYLAIVSFNKTFDEGYSLESYIFSFKLFAFKTLKHVEMLYCLFRLVFVSEF